MGLLDVRLRSEYNDRIEKLRSEQYPMIKDSTYLDHAGTTLYAKSLINRYSTDLVSNLYGNPHSASPSSQISTNRVDDCRLVALRLLNADPAHFDLIFVANATAGIKLVIETLRAQQRGFWYGYHKDSHTSLVGAREAATAGHRCFMSDKEVDRWLDANCGCNGSCHSAHENHVYCLKTEMREYQASTMSSASSDAHTSDKDEVSSNTSSEIHSALSMEHKSCHCKTATDNLQLLAYPAQSNMSGRRLPLSWTSKLHDMRMKDGRLCYSLLDAAALVSTSPLDLSDPNIAPDFTVLSFYKLFGFPDLGALIVRKDASGLFTRRQYFGGGTVDMVTCSQEQWHAPKMSSLHEMLEDGTLPVHNIVALKHAVDVQKELYGSINEISRHTSWLRDMLSESLATIRHHNGVRLCKIYGGTSPADHGTGAYGPIVAFNMRSASGSWISIAEVEKLAAIHNIHLRTGGLCNPGGIATALDLAPWEQKENFSAGVRCGGENDVVNGKPTGLIRLSFGAMSTQKDVEKLVQFLKDFFVEKEDNPVNESNSSQLEPKAHSLYVEKLTVYPIKSCAGWDVPPKQQWYIRDQGLAWDREWCIVHAGTRKVLSMKRYPKMALIRPHLDFQSGKLRIHYDADISGQNWTKGEIEVPLSADPSVFANGDDDYLYPANLQDTPSEVCGDAINIQVYTSHSISNFLSLALGIPCQLGRFPFNGGSHSARHMKPHLQSHKAREQHGISSKVTEEVPTPLKFSNESPILVITRPSLNQLTQDIARRRQEQGKPSPDVPAAVFRANIVLSQYPLSTAGEDELIPYAEDAWSEFCLGNEVAQSEEQQYSLNVLGSCRRCQIVCVDPHNGEKIDGGEPFVTLAKTRRKEGMCWFGVHCALGEQHRGKQAQEVGIWIGHEVFAR